MKYSILLLLVLMFSFSSCGNKEEVADNRSKVKVTVKQADSCFLGFGINFSGRIEPVKQSVVSTRLMGQVSRIFVKEGQPVNQGDLLISIRSNDLKARQNQIAATIDEVQAAFENAQNDFRRFQSLFDAGSASKKELEDATTRFKMAEAKLASVSTMKDELNEMASYADLRAPYNGVVGQKFLNEGDMASPGMPLLSMENHNHFQIVFQVPESDINSIQVGDKLSVTVHATGQMVQAVISEINPSRLHSGSQFQAVAQSDGLDGKLVKSGMTVLVAPHNLQKKSVSVDRKALIERGQLTGIWVVANQKQALLRWVRVGILNDDQAEILSGLSVGDSYVLNATGRLYDGVQVELN